MLLRVRVYDYGRDAEKPINTYTVVLFFLTLGRAQRKHQAVLHHLSLQDSCYAMPFSTIGIKPSGKAVELKHNVIGFGLYRRTHPYICLAGDVVSEVRFYLTPVCGLGGRLAYD